MATLTTPRLAIPYPDGNERVRDGDNAIGALGAYLEDLTKAGIPARIAAGSVGVTTASGASATAVVTFPVGRFTVAPIVSANQASLSTAYFAFTNAATTASVTVAVAHRDGTSAAINVAVQWIAIQM
jgi:hypothetical protein